MTRKSSLTPEEAAIVGMAIVELSDADRWIKNSMFADDRDQFVAMSWVARPDAVKPAHACAVGYLVLAALDKDELVRAYLQRDEIPPIVKSIDTKYWMKFGEHISTTNDNFETTNKQMASALCQLLLDDVPEGE